MANELEGGLRFIHMMEVETRFELSTAAIEIAALTDLLIAKGLISTRELDERKRLAIEEQNKRDQKRRLPMVGAQVDKYTVESPPIPCAENLPICRAACCSLVFNLSVQDLDEGAVKWDYAQPYRIRHQDRRCVHFEKERRCCGVYDKRPATCRTYDCRSDQRIWADYEKRIPSPELDKLAPPLP